MLGWHISVFRQTGGGSSPATRDAAQGTRLAVWQTGHGGLRWLDELVKADQAVAYGGNGYPNHYTAQAKYLIHRVVVGPPEANAVWRCGPDDILTSRWAGRTVIDQTAADACAPDEWLLVEAWDES